jgi:hypothetical protein
LKSLVAGLSAVRPRRLILQLPFFNAPEKRYNLCMQIALYTMRFLELLFFAGLAGSAVVVLISFFEDGKELFGDE